MSPDENKAKFLRGIEEVWNKHSWADAELNYAPDIVVHNPAEPEPLRGRAAFQQLFQMILTGFPDMHFAVEDVVAEGDRVVARWTFTGTHKGVYFGIPATGKAVTSQEIAIFRLVDGKVKELWPMPDLMTQMKQLGVIPDGPPPRAMLLLMAGVQRLGALWPSGRRARRQ